MSQKLMEGVLKSLKETLIKSAVQSLKPKEAKECSNRISALFDHNMTGGKYQRSRLALNTFIALSPKASEDEIFKAAKVAGTMEMVFAFTTLLRLLL
jgi:geranylgeranyl pyrophosphate synthase